MFNVKAIDDGYGDLKYSSGITTNLIPSFVTTFKPKPAQEMKSNDTQLTYISTKINENKYLVGDYASRLDPNIKWIGGENKHLDERFPILFKAGLGLMSHKPFERIETLVMGLPNNSFNQGRQEQLISIVKGKHELELSYDGVNYVDRHIIVDNVIIKKQPFGSLCYLILDKNGEIKDTKLASGFNVIVDIGARTLNILTIDAMMEQPELTTHSNDGMFVAFKQIGNYLEQNMNIAIPDGKLPHIIKRKSIKNIDLTNLINQAYQNHANIIASIIDTLLINSFGFVTNIIFTGGGSKLLQPYLQKHYNHVSTKFLNQFATVEGLRLYGIRQTNKNNKISVRIGNNEE